MPPRMASTAAMALLCGAPIACAAWSTLAFAGHRAIVSRQVPLACSRHAGVVSRYGDYDEWQGNGQSQKYYRDEDDAADVDVSAVEALLEERAQLRQDRDFTGADAIRDELRDQMGVVVSDRDFSWRVYDGPAGGRDGGYGRGRGRDQRGGFRRSGAQYSRDPYDTADIDVEYVESLIEERAALRTERDFAGADAIRDELRAMGVTIYDKDGVWRVDNGDGRSRGGYGRGGMRDGGAGGRGYYEQEDGPFYRRSPGDRAPIDEEYVQALVEERNAFRLERDYESADAIRDKLRGLNVFVSDRDRTWKVTSPSSSDRSGRRQPVDYGPHGHDYSRAEDDTAELDEERIDEINRMLADRLRAKLTREFDTADEVLAQLSELGVQVNDGRKAWRADDKGFPPASYRRIGPEGDIDAVRVEELINERTAARKVRDYEQADEIAAQLRQLNVHLDDVRRTWTVTSQSGYHRLGPPGPAEVEEQIEALLCERAEAQARRDFDTADGIQDKLRGKFGIKLNNKARNWSFSNQGS